MKPFRWNLHKREQLGRLLNSSASESKSTPDASADILEGAGAGFADQLAECAAKLVARSADSRLIFVGRSPENLFDYLSGVFESTGHENRIELLNISNRFQDIDEIRTGSPDAFRALQNHFKELKIAPGRIISSESPRVIFCDLVADGGTFAGIFHFLRRWTLHEQRDLYALLRKLGFIGITWRQKTSPNTWRWQQQADWVQAHPQLYIKNVSAPGPLWSYWGNQQKKVTRTNPPASWNQESILLPPRDEDNLQALAQAFAVYRLGMRHRTRFAERLSGLQEIREAWLRALVGDLRRPG